MFRHQSPSVEVNMDPSSCVVIVPVYSHVERACERGLRGLETRGYEVWRYDGGAAIDFARSAAASEALAAGFDEIMWIDADVGFPVDAVDTLRGHDLPIAVAIYPKRSKPELPCQLLAGDDQITFGSNGGLSEIKYGAGGFTLVRREVFDAIEEGFSLPCCNQVFGRAIVPYFLPLVIEHPVHGHWYLAEDYAFFHRAREMGYRVMVDTTIRLHHYGTYGYTWEDACGDRQRYETFHMTVDKPENRWREE